jgi:spectinomycin phosphotransferase
MLEKPKISDDLIISSIQRNYPIQIAQFTFLPLGADVRTAVYQAETKDGTSYFVKLRQSPFEDVSLILTKYLHDRGIPHVLAPLPTTSGNLYMKLNEYNIILFPYIDGKNGYEEALSDGHWRELGAALKKIHTTGIPKSLSKWIQRETFTPKWREKLVPFLSPILPTQLHDPAAQELAIFLQIKKEEIMRLVTRAEQLAQILLAEPQNFVLCHSDLHAGNILIDCTGSFYIIDWDEPILAPKERDLMYAGGGQFGKERTPAEEELLFYEGYGAADIDFNALAYYRYERIVEDLAIYCEQLLLSDQGGEDREQSLYYLKSNFTAGGTLEIARRADIKPLG